MKRKSYKYFVYNFISSERHVKTQAIISTNCMGTTIFRSKSFHCCEIGRPDPRRLQGRAKYCSNRPGHRPFAAPLENYRERASSDYINSGNIYTTDPLTKVRCGSSSRGEFYCIAEDCGIQDLQGQRIHFGSSSTPVHSHWAVGYILGHDPSGRSSFHSPVVIKMFFGLPK